MNITKDCIISVSEPFFKGSYPDSQFAGNRFYKGLIVSDSYGKSGQHTFSIEIIESDFADLKSIIRRKGRNVYPNCTEIEYPVNHKELAMEKKERKSPTSDYFISGSPGWYFPTCKLCGYSDESMAVSEKEIVGPPGCSC